MTYDEVHAHRYALSLDWIKPFLKDAMVLELGGESPFTAMLREQNLASAIVASTHDLRKPSESFGDAWDVVICMEVIEHVHDIDPTRHEWHGTGAHTMLCDAFRILKPGGLLFLTTPNAVSATVLHHAMRLAPPMLFRPHVREFAPYELDEVVRAAGFQITMRETFDVWNNAIQSSDHNRIIGFLRDYYPDTDPKLRGEDIFLLARKPIL